MVTVVVYVSPTGTSTKLTAFGVTSIAVGAAWVGSVFAMALCVLCPALACAVNKETPARISKDLRKPVTPPHLQLRVPTMLVPPYCPPPHKLVGFLPNAPLQGYWSRVHRRDRLRPCTGLPLRSSYRIAPMTWRMV